MPIEKSILCLAGEFAVAAELCRRNIYAQLTLGHRKRTDLLVVGESGRMFRIEVKAKQGRDWPNCRGISAPDSFLVFVDFAGKPDAERPVFYVLTAEEWRAFVERAVEHYRTRHPDRRVEITQENVIRLLDEVNKYGRPYEGVGVAVADVKDHQEAWQKLSSVVGK
jgi:hypothetical protein